MVQPDATRADLDRLRTKPTDVEAIPTLEPPVVNGYFVWKYADATGDWKTVEAAYLQIAAHCAERIQAAPRTYPEVAGCIGLARLARHFGKAADAQAAEAKAVAGLRAGADYDAFFGSAQQKLVERGHDWGYPPFNELRKPIVVTGLAPEIGRMLHDRSLEQVRRHADATMNAWDRTWFLTRAGVPTFFGQYWYPGGKDKAPDYMKGAWGGSDMQGDFGQENAMLTPDVAWTLFSIRAYVYGETGDALAKYLDVPWTKLGDTYQIQKLVAALRACGQPKWTGVR